MSIPISQLFRMVFFCPPVWTTSVRQMQSDQVSRALAQKEVPQSTIRSSLLTVRVLKPLGLRWCTSIGRDGGPRCPKVTCCWGILSRPLRPAYKARHCRPWFIGVAREAQTQDINSNCWMLGSTIFWSSLYRTLSARENEADHQASRQRDLCAIWPDSSQNEDSTENGCCYFLVSARPFCHSYFMSCGTFMRPLFLLLSKWSLASSHFGHYVGIEGALISLHAFLSFMFSISLQPLLRLTF